MRVRHFMRKRRKRAYGQELLRHRDRLCRSHGDWLFAGTARTQPSSLQSPTKIHFKTICSSGSGHGSGQHGQRGPGGDGPTAGTPRGTPNSGPPNCRRPLRLGPADRSLRTTQVVINAAFSASVNGAFHSQHRGPEPGVCLRPSPLRFGSALGSGHRHGSVAVSMLVFLPGLGGFFLDHDGVVLNRPQSSDGCTECVDDLEGIAVTNRNRNVDIAQLARQFVYDESSGCPAIRTVFPRFGHELLDAVA